MHLLHFLYRGESDHLTIFLSYYHWLSQYKPEVQNMIRRILALPISTKKPWKMLISDPYSVCREIPAPSMSLVERELSNRIEKCDHVAGDLKRIFRLTRNKARDRFIACLVSPEHLNVKAISAIYGASHFSLIDEVVGKLETSSSVYQFLIVFTRSRVTARALIRKWVKHDQYRFDWLMQVLRDLDPLLGDRSLPIQLVDIGKRNFCPTNACYRWLCVPWDRDIFGVTYPSPVDLFSVLTDLEAPSISVVQSSFTMRINHLDCQPACPKDPNIDHLTSSVNHHHTVLLNWPFLGTITSTRLLYPSAKLETLAPQAYKLTKMLSILEYTMIGNSNVLDLVRWVFKHFIDLELEDILPIKPMKVSGTTTHRLRARSFVESIMPNELPNRYSLVKGQSNTNTLINNIPVDVNLNYLAAMCYETCVWLWPLEYSRSLNDEHPTKFFFISTDHTPKLGSVCDLCLFDVEDFATIFDLSLLDQVESTLESRHIQLQNTDFSVNDRNSILTERSSCQYIQRFNKRN